MRKSLQVLMSIIFINTYSQTQIGQDILGDLAADQIGWEVKLINDGSRFAISAPQASITGLRLGRVRVYENNNNNWIQLGQDIVGPQPDINFGQSMAINGDGTVLVLGSNFETTSVGEGTVRVFQLTNGQWLQK